MFAVALLVACAAPQVEGKYVVLVDPGKGDEFLPAAKALAEFHGGTVERFDPEKLDAAFDSLKKAKRDFVVFVLPPEKIDVDLAHAILARSTALDDDPFPDFEYGFVTGRDGAAASMFVDRIKAAWKRDYGRTVGMFGSWEGPFKPRAGPLTAMKPLKADGEMRFTWIKDDAATQRKAARDALAAFGKKDALLFFSHGYPDRMEQCFRGQDVRDWKVELTPAVLVNCACYNGCPGRWFEPGPDGKPADKGVVPAADSVCLAVLDSGVPAYVAGIDPWHGPLAFQVFGHVFDDGLRLGAAAKAMHDRLALEFLPDRVAFPRTLDHPKRFAGEGTNNRRHNGAGMIFYGDPAFAPFAKSASKLGFAEAKPGPDGKTLLRLGTKATIDGGPGEDYMLPLFRMADYYSVKTADALKEFAPEVYRTVPLPAGFKGTPKVTVTAAKVGDKDVPTKAAQAVVEETTRGRVLHVRVPLDVRLFGSPWAVVIARNGVTVELEVEAGP